MVDFKGDPPAGGEEGLTPEEIRKLAEFNSQAAGGTENATNSHDTSTHQRMPGLEFLGCGYDVFGEYANARSCKQQVLDFSAESMVDQQFVDMSLSLKEMASAFNQIPTELKLLYSLPKTVKYLSLFRAETKYDFSSSVDEQTQKWSSRFKLAGGYGLFTGEAEARFDSKLSKLSTTEYSSLTASMVYFQLSLSYSLLHPAPLRKEVQEDLDSEAITPEQIFDTYGTHYLTSVLVGTRVTISCTIDTSRFKSKFGLETLVKASYGNEKTGNISAENQTTFNNDMEKFKEHRRTVTAGAGISDEQIEAISGGAESGVSVLKGGWHNPTLVDFPEGALQPIWLRCKEATRQAKLKAVFDGIAKNKKSQLNMLYTPVYLYRRQSGWTYYRLHRSAELNEVTDLNQYRDWVIQNDGKPLFYVLSTPLPGSVPLFEYRFGGNNSLYRYETGTWSGWLEYMASEECPGGPKGRSQWHRLAMKPIGYVFDPEQLGTDAASGATLAALYAYGCDGAPEGQHFYYSLDPDDHSRDDTEKWDRYLMPQNELVFLPEPSGGIDQYREVSDGLVVISYPWTDLAINQKQEFKSVVGWARRQLPQWYAWTLDQG